MADDDFVTEAQVGVLARRVGGEFLADASPASRGFKGWAFDPVSIATGYTLQLLANRAEVIWVPVASGRTINAIHTLIVTAGSGLTYSSLAVYDVSGALLEISTLAANAYQSTGQIDCTLDNPVTMTAEGLDSGVYVAIWAGGTTLPTFLRSGNNAAAINAGVGPNGGDKTRFGRTATAAGYFTDGTAEANLTMPLPQGPGSIWAAAS